MKMYFKWMSFILLILALLAYLPMLISSDDWILFGLGVGILVLSPAALYLLYFKRYTTKRETDETN